MSLRDNLSESIGQSHYHLRHPLEKSSQTFSLKKIYEFEKNNYFPSTYQSPVWPWNIQRQTDVARALISHQIEQKRSVRGATGDTGPAHPALATGMLTDAAVSSCSSPSRVSDEIFAGGTKE